MPPFPLPPDDIKAIAEYLHSVLAQAGRQGRPPEGEVVPPEKVLVGDAAAGQAYFAATCSRCHSVTGDLKGVASRVADPRELQNLWVSGGGGGRGGRGGGGAGAGTRRPVTGDRAPGSGPRVEGRLVRIDDFTVVLMQDGRHAPDVFTQGRSSRKWRFTIQRTRTGPSCRALADKDMHNVTAYLWGLK